MDYTMEIEVTIDIITSEIFFNDGTAFLLSSPPCLSKLSTQCIKNVRVHRCLL